MGVPTISSITPGTGHTGGAILTILGTNFRQQSAYLGSGRVPLRPPSVRVTIGTTQCSIVRVFSETELEVKTPALNAGTYDVTVENIDDDGVLVPGETVTSLAAFKAKLPDLTKDSVLARIVVVLMRAMRQQILVNTGTVVHTDYDGETGEEISLLPNAQLPQLILIGPQTRRASGVGSRQYTVQKDSNNFSTYRRGEALDLIWTLVGATDNTRQSLNLLEATRDFFKKSPFLDVDRDASDPSQGQVRYTMHIPPTGEFNVTTQPDSSNLRTFGGSFVVRGYVVEGLQNFPDDALEGRSFPAETLQLDKEAIEIEE